ncbi:MAG TPA: DUF6504 family protein, partial [Ornithinibacter sp.]|nr:DUF6504 family protein [Ornithinibacter sp.]
MVRRFRDPVQVKVQVAVRAGAAGEAPEQGPGEVPADVLGDVPADVPADVPVKLHSGVVPTAFIWRGRLYVVRDVLAHWRERRAWWRDALDAQEEQVRPGRTLAAA